MWKLFKKSLTTGIVTEQYPRLIKKTPKDFYSIPSIATENCTACGECAANCPTGALLKEEGFLQLDGAKCIGCGVCQEKCRENCISGSGEFELAVRNKEQLKVIYDIGLQGTSLEKVAEKLEHKIKGLFGRSLHIRHMDTGSCNGCDWEISCLLNPIHDIQRFGFDFVASPRHADLLLCTGPVTANLELALKRTYQAMPEPKLVAAVGTCACSGGIYQGSYAVLGGIDKILPVDVFIPGCPPRPQAIIFGLLAVVNRLEPKLNKTKA